MSASRGRGESGAGRGGTPGGRPGGKPGSGAGARAGARPGGKPGGSPAGKGPVRGPAKGAARKGAAKGGPPWGGAKASGAKTSGAKTSGAKKGAPRPPRVPVVPGAGGVGGKVPAAPEGPMRVQRALARAGVLSRREADQAVADGRVTINGTVATTGQSVDPAADRVTLDGKPVSLGVTSHRWIVLHKPAAIMTTSKDPEGRRTVFDLVERVPGLVYVGRLDFMTEGVLLLTTDGRAAHALTHPSNEVERTYVATVRGDAPGAVRAARRGVQLEDGLVVPREVSAEPLGNRRWSFEITIAEGRTHEVRRLCDALGLEVERLVRTRFGPVRLGELAPGATRALTPKERDVLEALVPTR